MKIAIIGIGNFGRSLALELAHAEHEVSAIDFDEEHINEVKDVVTFAAKADATDPVALQQLGVETMDAVIVAIGEGFEASVLITTRLQRMGAKNIYARVINDVHDHLLDLMEVAGKIRAEEMAAAQLARELSNAAVRRHFAIDRSHGIAEIALPRSLVGKTLGESALREKYQVNVITVRRRLSRGQKVEATGRPRDPMAYPEDPVGGVPGPDWVFAEGDSLILFGTEKALQQFARKTK